MPRGLLFFSKLSNFYFDFTLTSRGADPRARQRSENPTPGATRMLQIARGRQREGGGGGQAWN